MSPVVFRRQADVLLVANKDINLKFYKGKTLGIVGESAAAKAHSCGCWYLWNSVRGGDPVSWKGYYKTERRGAASEPSAYSDGVPGPDVCLQSENEDPWILSASLF